jgi:hypothetical protein
MSAALTIRLPHDAVVLPDNKLWTNRFEIRSSSSNRVYIIAQNKTKGHFACSCPGWLSHRTCKHLKAIGLPCFEVPFDGKLVA